MVDDSEYLPQKFIFYEIQWKISTQKKLFVLTGNNQLNHNLYFEYELDTEYTSKTVNMLSKIILKIKQIPGIAKK